MNQEKLSREAIVTEAIALLNEDGLDGVSLRKLAVRLGVKAPSLYWHYSDKSAVLAAVMERIFTECLESVPDHANWRRWMKAFGMALWQTQARVKDFGRLVTTTDMTATQLRRTTRRVRDRVRHLDLKTADAMQIQSSVQALVTGWSAFAHAPYARLLAKQLDFDVLARRDLDALITGKAAQLIAGSGRRAKRLG